MLGLVEKWWKDMRSSPKELRLKEAMPGQTRTDQDGPCSTRHLAPWVSRLDAATPVLRQL